MIQLRANIKKLDKELERFDVIIQERSKKHDESHISNNAMLVWSDHEAFLTPEELAEFRELNHERLLLNQELETLYKKDLMENKKEKRALRRALIQKGIKTSNLFTFELRQLLKQN